MYHQCCLYLLGSEEAHSGIIWWSGECCKEYDVSPTSRFCDERVLSCSPSAVYTWAVSGEWSGAALPEDGRDCRLGNDTGVDDRIGVDGQLAIGKVDIPNPITDDLAFVDMP